MAASSTTSSSTAAQRTITGSSSTRATAKRTPPGSRAISPATSTTATRATTGARSPWQGPRSGDILKKLCDEQYIPAKYYTFTEDVPLNLGERTIRALVSQTGYTGEYGFEIYCKAEDTVDLWKALLKAGEPEGLIPCGLGARDTLRLEASMPLYGHEMNDEITPKMAGLPCKLTGKDFIGRDALVALGAPKMKRIGMKVVGRGIVREHCDLYTMDGEKIGWASSGTFAPYIGCGVAMGYIPAQDIEIGKHLNADVRGRMVELEIVPMPFYKLER